MKRSKTVDRRFLAPPAVLCVLFALGCSCDDDETVVVVGEGVVAADFQSIADYLNDPAVDLILSNMPRHSGNNPPDVSGQYSVSAEIIASSIPGIVVGEDSGNFSFCLGQPAGSSLDARVFDSSIEDGGASSFIEGNGDHFTAYTAFRSVDVAPGTSQNCEIHEVVVISGRREADGSLSDLFIGEGVVGLVGTCLELLVDDVKVSHGTADRTGEGCSSAAGGSLDGVEVVVNNFLKNRMLIFVDYDDIIGPQPFVVFPEELDITQPVVVPPGFFLTAISLPPTRIDIDGNFVEMGEVVGVEFSQDLSPAGSTVFFDLTNQVQNDEYFAPRPTNFNVDPVYAIVNSDLDVPDPLELLGADSGCLCPITPVDVEPNEVDVDLGYYLHTVASNVRFFNFADDTKILPTFEDFVLEEGSGAVELAVVFRELIAGR